MSTSVTIPGLERRRKRAVAAAREGQKPATVAQVLGVDRGTVYRWLRMARRPGEPSGGTGARPSRVRVRAPRARQRSHIPEGQKMSATKELVGVGVRFLSLQIRDDVGAVTWYYQGVPVDGTPQVVCRMNNGIEAAELAPAGDTPALRQDGEGLPPRIVVGLADGRGTCQYRQRETAPVRAPRPAGS